MAVDQVARNKTLGRQLILDELFDLTLYRRLALRTTGKTRGILEELIPIEEKHVAYWQEFFGQGVVRLDGRRRLKLSLLMAAAWLFGDRAIHLLLESIEVRGIQKYLTVWATYRDTPLAEALRDILNDEFGHEDSIVTRFRERQISGEMIRNIFLGLNDGLVEILGAVSGFFAAFSSATHVFIAALMVAVAGAFSMAAGVYVSSGSEKEMILTQRLKYQFLGQPVEDDVNGLRPFTQAVVVGVGYLSGSLVPIVPVFFGARTVLASALAAGAMITAVSFILAFISGMDIHRRVATNLAITALAVAVTYAIGTLANKMWGLGL